MFFFDTGTRRHADHSSQVSALFFTCRAYPTIQVKYRERTTVECTVRKAVDEYQLYYRWLFTVVISLIEMLVSFT